MPDTEEVLDPIARRNATAYRILAMVSQDSMAHAVLLAELETSGLVEKNTASSRLRRHLFGKNRARTLQERKDEQEKSNANILSALVTTLGVAVTLFLIGRMMNDEENPLDPESRNLKPLQRRKAFR
jgi:Na+/phosphate symporter